MGCLFSRFTWTLYSKFENRIPIKKLYTNMHIFKNELLPVLVPGVAFLFVYQDSRYGFCQPSNLEIWIFLEK